MNGPKMGWDTGWKPGIQSIPAIAPGYKKQTYPEGAVVSIGDKLYTSNTEITTPEDFDKSHWDETDVSEYLNELNSKIEGIGNPVVLIGEATVSELNGTIEGLKPGWAYTLTDAGTLTAGTVEVEAGDEVAWSASETWVKIGGDTGKVKVFQVVYDTDHYTWPSFSEIDAAVTSGKSACLVQTNPAGAKTVYWLTFRSTSSANLYFRFVTGTSNYIDIYQDGSVSSGNLLVKTAAIAPDYDSTATYAVGDAVMRGGLRYVCNTAITQAEDWNSGHWTQTSVEDEIGNVETLLAAL